MLLDEGCLARQGTRRRCSPLPWGLRRSKPWLLHGRVHVRRWSKTVSARPHHARLLRRLCELCARLQRAGYYLKKRPRAGALQNLQGTKHEGSGCMGLPGPRDQSLPGRVERPDDRHSRKQAVQRSGTRRHGQCRHRSRSFCHAHRTGSHGRSGTQPRPRSLP